MDDQDQPCGFTANSFSSVSLDPPLLLVSIAKSAFGLTVFSESKGFAINILAEQQRNLSNLFASQGADKFANVEWQQQATGSPLLDNVVAWFDCENYQQVDAGDHVILIGKVVDYQYNSDSPLGFCRGAYVSFGLSPKMLELVSSTGGVQVGALIENEGKILLQADSENDLVRVPVADQVGNKAIPDSLLGLLATTGIDVQLPFLFAAYSCDDMRAIYYRGELLSNSNVTQSRELQFYAHDDIPWEKIRDLANLSMIRRFFREREIDNFGVYIGDYDAGDVYPLPS